VAEQSSVPQAEGPLGLDLSPVTPAEHLLSAALAPGGELYQPRPEGLFGHLLQTAIEPLQAAPAAAQGTLADRLAGLGNIVIPYVVGGAPRDALSAGVKLSTGDLGGYHGTPHTFAPEPGAPFGSFRNEAIGSGEGAQAYGWGHYIAGNPKIAEAYQQALAGEPVVTIDGINAFEHPDVNANNPHIQMAINEINAAGNVGDAIKQIDNHINYLSTPSHPNANNYGVFDSEIQRLKDAKNWISSNRNSLEMQPAGHLLEVHILPEESQLLDWDKPLSEQSPEVQVKLAPIWQEVQGESSLSRGGSLYTKDPDPAGSQLYRQLWRISRTDSDLGQDAYRRLQQFGRGDQAVSQVFHSAGIPGLKYLDAGSRNISVAPLEGPSGAGSWQVFNNSRINRAGEGQLLSSHPTQAEAEAAADRLRTHNYVIFHPSNLRIVARDGTPLTPVDHDPFAEGAP